MVIVVRMRVSDTRLNLEQWSDCDLRERIHPTNQHMEVVQGGDGGRQMTLGMVQLFDVTSDLFYLRHNEMDSIAN